MIKRLKRNVLAGLLSALVITAASGVPLTPPSAGLPAPSSSTPSSGTLTTAAPRLWNLQNADIRAVIEAVSRITGKNFLVDPRVEGKVTLASSSPISNDGLYQMFLSALQILGYSAVPSGNVIKIVPNLSARQISTAIATPQNPGVGDEVVVQVINLQNVPAPELVPTLQPLLPDASTVSAYMPSNSLILAGQASNVQRLTKIIENIDHSGSNQIQVIPLKYAAASKVQEVLQSLQNADRAAGRVSNVSFAADAQSNSMILSGTRAQRLRLNILVDKLDTPTQRASSSTEVIKLNYLQAKKLAPILSKIAHSAYLNEGAGGAKGSKASTVAAVSTASDDSGDGTDNFNKEVSIQAEPDSNSIIISAPPPLMLTLKNVIQKVDVQPQQVLVEAIIAQVNQNLAHKLGISWGTAASSDSSTTTDSSGNVIQTTSSGNGQFQPGIGYISGNTFTNVGFLANNNLQAVVSALNTNSNADVLSTPSIAVTNNQKAQFKVGKTISTANRQYAMNNTQDNSYTPYTNVTPTEVDLKLIVTPQISPNNMVQLKLTQINDSLQDPDNPTLTPVINNSAMQTNVLVKSGQILVLGGLISHDLENTVSKIPILGYIPIIGSLFQSKNKSVEKRYLLVFIRPLILNNEQTMAEITKRNYDYVRQQQLLRWRGQDLITNINEAPLLPAYGKPTLALPPPFKN